MLVPRLAMPFGMSPRWRVIALLAVSAAGLLPARPMRQGAARRNARCQRACRPAATVSKTASPPRNSGTASPASPKASSGRAATAHAPTSRAPSRRASARCVPKGSRPRRGRARAVVLPRRLLRADAAAGTSARRPDHADQHEVVRLPLFRREPALGSAVPQRRQRRAQAATAAIPARSTGRTRPTTTAACWCTCPSISTPGSPA